MSTRREFLAVSAATAASTLLDRTVVSAAALAEQQRQEFDPWLEVDGDVIRRNLRALAQRAPGRRILAVAKNNAYGLGLSRVGPVLDAAPEVAMIAVVKPAEALALRQAGVRKPILLMGLFSVEQGTELARAGVRLAPFTDDAPERLREIARRSGGPVNVHAYIDTGMSRMGMPWHRALPWLETIAGLRDVRIEGAFTEMAEGDADVDQLARFNEFRAAARDQGIATGTAHAASSHALFFRADDVLLDAVRPGLAMYGAYPAGARELGRVVLEPAFRLRARVVRVEQIRAGDGVSYGRNYIAERPTWIATLPIGHADGYPRAAVKGGEVLIGDRTYRVIGAVSASHTILEIGAEKTVAVGDVATLVGGGHPSVHPNTLAERAGISVYDVLMHLSPQL